MSDFIFSFNLFGEFDNFDDWDAAEEREIVNKTEKRHKEITPGELNQIEDEKDEINTKKNTKWAVTTLRDFIVQKEMDSSFEKYSADALN